MFPSTHSSDTKIPGLITAFPVISAKKSGNQPAETRLNDNIKITEIEKNKFIFSILLNLDNKKKNAAIIPKIIQIQ
jgi:hypothetical protein